MQVVVDGNWGLGCYYLLPIMPISSKRCYTCMQASLIWVCCKQWIVSEFPLLLCVSICMHDSSQQRAFNLFHFSTLLHNFPFHFLLTLLAVFLYSYFFAYMLQTNFYFQFFILTFITSFIKYCFFAFYAPRFCMLCFFSTWFLPFSY